MQYATPDDPLDASRLLIAEFIAVADVTQATRFKYRAHLGELLAWLNHLRSRPGGQPVQLVDATASDLHGFMAYLRSGDRYAAVAHHRTRGELSASARKNALASIHSFYRYLIAVGVMGVDPSATIRPPHVPQRPGLHLTAEEVRRLLDAPGGAPRERIQAYLLTYTAARTCEIRELRWRDVNFEGATITIYGKHSKVRVVDVHPRLMGELRRWYICQDDEAQRNPAIRRAKLDPDTDHVLLTRTGLPVAATVIARQLKARAARAGVRVRQDAAPGNASAVSPHALRRTFATILLDRGYHIDAIADVLGHASIDTTRRHYAFGSNARRRDTIHGYDV